MVLRALALLALACGLIAVGCQGSESVDGEASSADALTSADATAQMRSIVETARAAAADRAPEGRCYAAVARYIDTNGYGKMPAQPEGRIGRLPSIPDDFGALAHQFADYVDAGHAGALGLRRLDLHSPYDAPAGAIVVVRAGSPGTAHPTAGDISIAAGNGVFYNDGNMSYGGPDRFPAGNDFVLGIYVPQGDAAPPGPKCKKDADCSHGFLHRELVCGAAGTCITGCHADVDCHTGKSCQHTSPHWSCR